MQVLAGFRVIGQLVGKVALSSEVMYATKPHTAIISSCIIQQPESRSFIELVTIKNSSAYDQHPVNYCSEERETDEFLQRRVFVEYTCIYIHIRYTGIDLFRRINQSIIIIDIGPSSYNGLSNGSFCLCHHENDSTEVIKLVLSMRPLVTFINVSIIFYS